MKNLIITAAIVSMLAPFATFAISQQELSNLTSIGNYVICTMTWQSAPTFSSGNVLADTGYSLSNCAAYSTWDSYMNAMRQKGWVK